MKYLRYIMFFCSLFFLEIKFTCADILSTMDSYIGTVNYKHVYFVESANFTKEALELEGYSFISHRDNYGYGLDGYGNLYTYIIACRRLCPQPKLKNSQEIFLESFYTNHFSNVC